jgi:hypothetical protein
MPTLENGQRVLGITGLEAGSAASGRAPASPELSLLEQLRSAAPEFEADWVPHPAELWEIPRLPETRMTKTNATDGNIRAFMKGLHTSRKAALRRSFLCKVEVRML